MEQNSVTRSYKLDLLSNLNVHNDLTMVGVALLEDEVIASQCYASRRVTKDKWLVQFSGNDVKGSGKSFLQYEVHP